MRLSRFHRLVHVGRTPVPDDGLELKPCKMAQQGGFHIIMRSSAGTGDDDLLLARILDRIDPMRLPDHEYCRIGLHTAQKMNLAGIVLDLFRVQDLGHGDVLRQLADNRSVLCSGVIEIVCALGPALPGHVLNDDSRVAGNMPGDKARHDATVDSVHSARAKRNDHRDRLALVEIGDGLRSGGRRNGNRRQRRNSCCKHEKPSHSILPVE